MFQGGCGSPVGGSRKPVLLPNDGVAERFRLSRSWKSRAESTDEEVSCVSSKQPVVPKFEQERPNPPIWICHMMDVDSHLTDAEDRCCAREWLRWIPEMGVPEPVRLALAFDLTRHGFKPTEVMAGGIGSFCSVLDKFKKCMGPDYPKLTGRIVANAAKELAAPEPGMCYGFGTSYPEVADDTGGQIYPSLADVATSPPPTAPEEDSAPVQRSDVATEHVIKQSVNFKPMPRSRSTLTNHMVASVEPRARSTEATVATSTTTLPPKKKPGPAPVPVCICPMSVGTHSKQVGAEARCGVRVLETRLGRLYARGSTVVYSEIPGVHPCSDPAAHSSKKSMNQLTGSGLKGKSSKVFMHKGVRTARVYNNKWSVFLCMMICHLPAVMSYFVCGMGQAQSIWKFPDPLDCRYTEGALGRVEVSLYERAHTPVPVMGYKCYDEFRNYTTNTGVFMSKGIVSVVEYTVPVPAALCRSRAAGGVGTSSSGEVAYEWCCKDVESTVVTGVVESIPIYISDGVMVSPGGDMSHCVTTAGSCLLKHSTVVWETKDVEERCEFSDRGDYGAVMSGTHIMVDALNMAVSLGGEQTQTCVGQITVAPEGIGYIIRGVSNNVESQVSNKTWVSNLPQMEYVAMRLQREYRDGLANIYSTVCHSLNRELSVMRQKASYDATSVMRVVLQLDNISAMVTGDVVSVWQCEEVNVTAVYWESKYKGECYTTTPVEFTHRGATLVGFVQGTSREIRLHGVSVDCHEMPEKYYMSGEDLVTYNGGERIITNRQVVAIPLSRNSGPPKPLYEPVIYKNDIEYNVFFAGMGALGSVAENVIKLNRFAIRYEDAGVKSSMSVDTNTIIAGARDGARLVEEGATRLQSWFMGPMRMMWEGLQWLLILVIVCLVVYVLHLLGVTSLVRRRLNRKSDDYRHPMPITEDMC